LQRQRLDRGHRRTCQDRDLGLSAAIEIRQLQHATLHGAQLSRDADQVTVDEAASEVALPTEHGDCSAMSRAQ
jgi:hypothetical protein